MSRERWEITDDTGEVVLLFRGEGLDVRDCGSPDLEEGSEFGWAVFIGEVCGAVCGGGRGRGGGGFG